MIRTVALELERLYNHVGDIGNIGAGASYHYGTSAGSRMKEALQQVNEQPGGQPVPARAADAGRGPPGP